MQRYLRQPLAALAPFVGLATPGITNANEAIVVDALGDNLLGGYNAVDDAEWIWQHNAVRDCLRACATCSGITTAIEQGKRRDDDATGGDADDDVIVTSNGKRHGGFPGDLELRGDHGYVPAGDNNVWTDIVITTGTCKSHAPDAAREEGGAAQKAADRKHTKHRINIPSNKHFVASAFEADGYTSPIVHTLLRGFSKKRTDRDDADDCAKSAWFNFFQEALAFTLARSLARTILARAEAIDDFVNGRRVKRTAVDAEATRNRLNLRPPRTSRRR